MASVLAALTTSAANALSQKIGNFDFRLNGYGTAGFFEKQEDPLFLGDFSIRAQALYNPTNSQTFGLVYVMDATALHLWKK